MTKPTILFVPGAWHTPAHYQSFLQKLQDAGYSTSSKQLPSVGAAEPEKQTVAADAAFIRENLLLPDIEQGKDVILIMHSYGGCPGADAAKGLSKAERTAAGKTGGIVGLIFMCAFVANEGDSLRSKLPGNKLDPWNILDEETGQITVDKPEEVFYNGIDSGLADVAVKGLKKQAHTSFITPSGPPAWKDEVFNGRRAYIKCQKDRAIPYIAQNMVTSLSGLEWHELDLDSSHSPFLTHGDQMLKFIDERVEEWVS
ncbi:Alpha/beta hydrolase fold-1 [Thelonectria olida]|uniref:Alpha/beta hydrolase fold-1 n=1 Tax=Thelonectria olida TaxID=1576542 RepID=A0A9P8W9N7_9HYPO|nr:Alpha/beta hydrolase fold-1 [Thelonectria olida]